MDVKNYYLFIFILFCCCNLSRLPVKGRLYKTGENRGIPQKTSYNLFYIYIYFLDD